MKKKEIITVMGVLYPLYESRAGSVTGVMLSADDEREYVIEGDRYITDMINLCQEEVRVKGRVHEVEGRWYLEPLDYEITVRDNGDYLYGYPFYDEEAYM